MYIVQIGLLLTVILLLPKSLVMRLQAYAIMHSKDRDISKNYSINNSIHFWGKWKEMRFAEKNRFLSIT